MRTPSICFVGLENLPLLAPEFGRFRVGGAELQQTLLATTLARRGFRVSMVVEDLGQPDGASWRGVETFKAYANSDGIPVLRFVHPRWTGLWAAMKRANADLYYVSCAGALVGQVASFVRVHGRRMIFRVASDDDCDPSKIRNIRFWRDRKLYAFGLRNADARFAQTAQQQAALRQHYKVDSVIAPSLADQGGRNLPYDERTIDVLWAGTVYSVKRPEIYVDVASRLPGMIFYMLGGAAAGAEPLFDKIKASTASLTNMKVLGHVSYHEISDFFDNARVFVNTSEIEGFPNTYLQAWARGTPVVAFFDPDGLIVREGLGRVVSTVDEMFGAVQQLRNDLKLWAETSERCRAFMNRRYSEDRFLAPYLETIDRLVRQ